MFNHIFIVTMIVATFISANGVIREVKETATYLVGYLIR